MVDIYAKEMLDEINSDYQLKRTIGNLILEEKVKELETEIKELKIMNQILKHVLKRIRTER